MTILDLTKSIDEVQEVEALIEDYYLMRISGEPTIEPNKKKKDGVSAEEGGGDNYIIRMVVQSDRPEYHGRMFTIWLEIPNAADADRIMGNGQSQEDRKIEKVRKVAEAFNGGPLESGTKAFDFQAGMEAMFYVDRVPAGVGFENPLLDFDNHPPQPAM